MRRFLSVVIVLICATVVGAQTNKGGISGTVSDQNGAVVPGATVIITNLGTNQSLTLTTSDSGSYSVNQLEPVTYSIRVEMTGFKKSIIGRVKVDTATVTTANISLETGTVEQTVTITT